MIGTLNQIVQDANAATDNVGHDAGVGQTADGVTDADESTGLGHIGDGHNLITDILHAPDDILSGNIDGLASNLADDVRNVLQSSSGVLDGLSADLANGHGVLDVGALTGSLGSATGGGALQGGLIDILNNVAMDINSGANSIGHDVGLSSTTGGVTSLDQTIGLGHIGDGNNLITDVLQAPGDILSGNVDGLANDLSHDVSNILDGTSGVVSGVLTDLGSGNGLLDNGLLADLTGSDGLLSGLNGAVGGDGNSGLLNGLLSDGDGQGGLLSGGILSGVTGILDGGSDGGLLSGGVISGVLDGSGGDGGSSDGLLSSVSGLVNGGGDGSGGLISGGVLNGGTGDGNSHLIDVSTGDVATGSNDLNVSLLDSGTISIPSLNGVGVDTIAGDAGSQSPASGGSVASDGLLSTLDVTHDVGAITPDSGDHGNVVDHLTHSLL